MKQERALLFFNIKTIKEGLTRRIVSYFAVNKGPRFDAAQWLIPKFSKAIFYKRFQIPIMR